MAFIYKITNLINNKIYVGKSKINDPAYFGSGLKIVAAIKKYGIDCFRKELIEECIDTIVNVREIYWINTLNSTDDITGYNISRGGEGGTHYWDTLTEEERLAHNKKISDSKIGKINGPHKFETKQKMSASFNRDPEILKKRASANCKSYTCINHDTKELYITVNIKEFCEQHGLNLGSMRHNARTRKTICNKVWSCRTDDFNLTKDEIILFIEDEYNKSQQVIKEKIRARDKRGTKNPMYGKRHNNDTKEKIRQKRLGTKRK